MLECKLPVNHLISSLCIQLQDWIIFKKILTYAISYKIYKDNKFITVFYNKYFRKLKVSDTTVPTYKY